MLWSVWEEQPEAGIVFYLSKDSRLVCSLATPYEWLHAHFTTAVTAHMAKNPKNSIKISPFITLRPSSLPIMPPLSSQVFPYLPSFPPSTSRLDCLRVVSRIWRFASSIPERMDCPCQTAVLGAPLIPSETVVVMPSIFS